MKFDWMLSCLRSRAFGTVCYFLLAAFLGVYLYVNFVKPGQRNELNISCFVYRDINRNGIYDLEDRPYAGLKATLSRPRWGPVATTSNIAGFANFVMSVGHRKAGVNSPGHHTLTIEPPARWTITSRNGVQTVNFIKLPEAPAGIVAEQTYQAVGVAPELTISGTVKVDEPNGDRQPGRVKAYSATGETMDLPLSHRGDYSFPAAAGEWRIDYFPASGRSISRTVNVKSYPVRVAGIDPKGVTLAAKPRLQRLGFDTLTSSDTLYEVPHGYGGLNWVNWVAIHQKLTTGHGFINAAISAEYVAYNSSGHPAVVFSDRPFDFVGAYITRAWPESEKYDVIVKAWRQDTLVYEDRFRVTVAGPLFFDADFRSVTRIEIASEAHWQIVVDDLEYRVD